MKYINEQLKTLVTDEYDVAVCGGGFAGISAALASARQGKKTVLFEKQYMLGGLGTAGIVTIYLPLCDGMGHQVTYGIAEELFFNNNAKTAIQVGQARGVILLAAVNKNVKIFEYTPLQVKQSVVGYGRADKCQIQQMTKAILSLSEIPKPDDVADALAIAICHAHSHRMVKMGVHM